MSELPPLNLAALESVQKPLTLPPGVSRENIGRVSCSTYYLNASGDKIVVQHDSAAGDRVINIDAILRDADRWDDVRE